MKYYYLINGKIMAANEKMPEINEQWHNYNSNLLKWSESLQPCEISESELCLILSNVSKLDYDNPIEVTDIISDNNGVISFKEYPKQVEEIEAVDEMFLDLQEFTKEFVKIHEQAPHPFDVYFWIKENNKYTITRNI